MNTDTGEIRQFASKEEARKAGFNRPLSLEEFKAMNAKTREERLKWAAERRAAEREEQHRTKPRKAYKKREKASR